MKKNLLKWMTILMVAIVSVGFVSCGGDDDDENNKKADDSSKEDKVDLTYNYVYHHIEGRYVGTFDDVYDQTDTQYSGFVDISEIPNQAGTIRKYKIIGAGGENIAIAGEYWLDAYNPEYDGDGLRFAQIKFVDRGFYENHEEDNSVLYWHLDSGFMWLNDMQMNLYFERFVMGEHQYYEPRWCYRFVGKKESW